MGSSPSKLSSTTTPSTTTPSTTTALNILRKLGSAAIDAKHQLACKRHKIKPETLRELELSLKEVHDFVNRGSDSFFVYNHRTGGYEAKNLATLMKEVARLTTILEETTRGLAVAAGHAGPSYILSNGSMWERAI